MCGCSGKKNIAVNTQRGVPRQNVSPNPVQVPRIFGKDNKKQQAVQEYQNWLRSINGMPKSVLYLNKE